MYSVYQHWDPLKTCIVGRSYPPEFYAWIKNTKTRSIFERIAQETEEDYQALIKILNKFNVNVLRMYAESDSNTNFKKLSNSYESPPMCPRDLGGMFGSNLIIDTHSIIREYSQFKDALWPEVNTYDDFLNLPKDIYTEVVEDFATKYSASMVNNIARLANNNCDVKFTNLPLATASTTRIGKDIFIGDDVSKENQQKCKEILGNEYRLTFTGAGSHTDGVFCPVVPGLIISLNDIPTYKDTFPDWEVVYLPDQSWSKVKSFCDLKEKNKGKWWIPGEEYNDDVIEVVDTWLSKWVGYVEETVFDVNMLVITEKNGIVNNYNKQVFNALERYGVTPHICNFRHRYFWDGGIHCNTLDLDREGEMKDYFPERNIIT